MKEEEACGRLAVTPPAALTYGDRMGMHVHRVLPMVEAEACWCPNALSLMSSIHHQGTPGSRTPRLGPTPLQHQHAQGPVVHVQQLRSIGRTSRRNALHRDGHQSQRPRWCVLVTWISSSAPE
ncbi:protein of unknown function [Cyanobium sp. NIES-981]|nr:protein of unknown function [Cyanobium sp. NIES-981]